MHRRWQSRDKQDWLQPGLWSICRLPFNKTSFSKIFSKGKAVINMALFKRRYPSKLRWVIRLICDWYCTVLYRIAWYHMVMILCRWSWVALKTGIIYTRPLWHKELLAELWKMWKINNDKDKNRNSYKSNDDTKCSTGKVVHFFIAFQLFRMRDWKATKGPVSLPTS